MAFRSYTHGPSSRTLMLTQVSIIMAVIFTALASIVVVRQHIERYQITPEQISISDANPWHALGR